MLCFDAGDWVSGKAFGLQKIFRNLELCF